MVCRVVAVLLVMALLPREGTAQPLESARQLSLHPAIIVVAEEAQPAAGQSNAGQPRRSRRAMWIGLGAGFAGGMVFGEYYFGRHLDMPHGPDMLMGGMIGAGAGALVGWLVTRGRSTPSTAVLWPITTPHTQALSVSFPLGRRTQSNPAKSP